MLGLLVALMLQAGAAATEPPAGLVIHPMWIGRPGAEQYAETFPTQTRTEHLAGQAVLDCVVTGRGTMSECHVLSQEPADGPFGDAALKASRYFKMRPEDAEGQPTSGRHIRIPFQWLISSGLASGPIRVRRPQFTGAEIDVNCRFRQGRFDNCLVLKSSTSDAAARDAALTIAAALPMPKVTTSSGRILLPLRFVAD